ncbi:hypothetical protein SLA2020_428000 [Shorea laevis]
MTHRGCSVFVSSTVFEEVLRCSVLKDVDLKDFHSKYQIPFSVTLRAPRPKERAVVPSGNKEVCFYVKILKAGMRFPILAPIRVILAYLNLSPAHSCRIGGGFS